MIETGTATTDLPYVKLVVNATHAGKVYAAKDVTNPYILNLIKRVKAKDFRFSFVLRSLSPDPEIGKSSHVEVLHEGFSTGGVSYGYSPHGRSGAMVYTFDNHRINMLRTRGKATTSKTDVAVKHVLKHYERPSTTEILKEMRDGLLRAMGGRKYATLWSAIPYDIIEQMLSFLACDPELIQRMLNAGLTVPADMADRVRRREFKEALMSEAERTEGLVFAMRGPDGEFYEVGVQTLPGETSPKAFMEPASAGVVAACTLLSLGKEPEIDWLGLRYEDGSRFAIKRTGLARVAQDT